MRRRRADDEQHRHARLQPHRRDRRRDLRGARPPGSRQRPRAVAAGDQCDADGDDGHSQRRHPPRHGRPRRLAGDRNGRDQLQRGRRRRHRRLRLLHQLRLRGRYRRRRVRRSRRNRHRRGVRRPGHPQGWRWQRPALRRRRLRRDRGRRRQRHDRRRPRFRPARRRSWQRRDRGRRRPGRGRLLGIDSAREHRPRGGRTSKRRLARDGHHHGRREPDRLTGGRRAAR